MKVKTWNPEKWDGEFINAGMGRVKKAAEVVKKQTLLNLNKKIGKGWGKGPHKFNISHGPYQVAYSKGRYHYTGEPWTARNAGDLVKTIRVTTKNDTSGALIGSTSSLHRNVRVYAGNYMVWWAKIFEYYKPYLRPALNSSKAEIRGILENG